MENNKSAMKCVKKWTGNIFFLVGVVLVAFLLFSVVQSRLSNGPPTIAGHKLYIVIGGSMSPTIDVGSLAVIKPIDDQAIKVGDIITYKGLTSESITTHRVAKILSIDGEPKFITRGDANDVDDPTPLEPSQIIGRVLFAIPYVGSLLSFAQSKSGLVLLVIIPGIALIIYEIRSVVSIIRKMKLEKVHNIGIDETTNVME
ncbi:MAG: signal peptidase I [Bacillota bacterium]|nr:signal peptidase I [Bacillota bacterium]